MRKVYRKGYASKEQAQRELDVMYVRGELNEQTHKPIIDSFHSDHLDVIRWLITIENN